MPGLSVCAMATVASMGVGIMEAGADACACRGRDCGGDIGNREGPTDVLVHPPRPLSVAHLAQSSPYQIAHSHEATVVHLVCSA